MMMLWLEVDLLFSKVQDLKEDVKYFLTQLLKLEVSFQEVKFGVEILQHMLEI